MCSKTVLCNIKIRRTSTRHADNIDFKPVISKIKSLSVVLADKSYDSVEIIMY